MKHKESMTYSTSFFRYLLPFLILAASLVVSFAIIVQAQTDATGSPQTEPTDEEIAAKGITFPVPGLGNCGSKSECRDYCNKSGNMLTCIKFAREHGLMNKDEASRAEKFREKLAAGGGPGGCNSPQSCRAFCENPDNLEVCIKFAEEHGLKYQENEKAKKFVQLIKQGETPGGCKSREECESYCSQAANREECITFAQKMGFMDERQAEMFRKTGGKGPGGCNSEATCKAYCNDPGHQEECFRFAEEHGLIDQEEIKHAKEGFVRLRQGLEQAPPEVAQCLKSALGPNIIEDIQSGNLTPGSQIGERVKACFEKFGHRSDAREGFNQAPPEIIACVKEKLGDVFEKIRAGEVMPTPEMGDAFRICGEKLRLLREEADGGGEEGMPDVGGFLRSAPPGVASCLKEKLGDDFERAREEGTAPGQEVKATLRECFESFHPETPQPQGDDAADYEKFKPADFKDFRNFIRHEDTSTPDSRPGLNRETFEKFRQGGDFPTSSEGFRPPEGAPQQLQEQFRQQYEQQFKEQYQQQYQQPTAPPPVEEPKTGGNIWAAIKTFFRF